MTRPGGDVPGMKRFPYRSNGGGGGIDRSTVVMVEAHAAQLDAYGQRSYKARPSERSRTGNRMRFARAMDGRCSSRRRVKGPCWQITRPT